MSALHFLNVKEGDCSIIEHNSGHVSVIDVCNAELTSPHDQSLARHMFEASRGGVPGNFQQKRHPVNPISYMHEHNIGNIFRYIQTHPDMDHMDGIEVLFREFQPVNFWDTNNDKEMADSSWEGSPYNWKDWEFYKNLRDTKPKTNPKRLALLAGAKGQYWNRAEGDTPGGDGIQVLAPTQDLINKANQGGDYNQCSYVLLYRTAGKSVVFGGDSHDETWEHILTHNENDITNIDILIAPHHGRSSGRSYEFLDVLKPTITFFGNARSEHLAYSAWNYRNLEFITNNQANCMIVNFSQSATKLYVTNESFAVRYNPLTDYNSQLKAWFLKDIQ